MDTFINRNKCAIFVCIVITKAVGIYLPEERKTLRVGNFEVSCSRLETKQSYVIRKMKIKYSGKVDNYKIYFYKSALLYLSCRSV